MLALGDALMRGRRGPVSARLGIASALAGVALIVGLTLTSASALTPALTVGAALVVGGLSFVINGLIGREVAQRKELERDLHSAARIQRSLFPKDIPAISGCEFAMACRMSREIGGDCVDAFALDDGHLAVLVGDVSGKGIAAALVMSAVQAQFKTLTQVGLPLHEIARRIDLRLLEQGNGRYVTAVMLLLDTMAGTIEYLSAGHVPFVILAPGIDPLPIDSTGPPLGMLAGMTRDVQRRQLSRGSAIILVTDGVTERTNGTSDYGLQGLVAATAPLHGTSARDAVDALLADCDRFAAGIKADDDLTIVSLKMIGDAPAAVGRSSG